MKNEHLGSNFDDFLEEEGLRAEAEAAAIKRVNQGPSSISVRDAQPRTGAVKQHTARTVGRQE